MKKVIRFNGRCVIKGWRSYRPISTRYFSYSDRGVRYRLDAEDRYGYITKMVENGLMYSLVVMGLNFFFFPGYFNVLAMVVTDLFMFPFNLVGRGM